ncbi:MULTISPECIES: hypothetical protein [Helicobacter]|uniref:hypothetical protein n=1 Tax=Helicobacter TaxID=209 RepID=UPI00051CEBF0|nr:hypothetical protein [Helicobacter sp. MIT 03-1616]TLD87088.1 hypothetical protein LS67_007065 [Helicobacter sp. MIT 03-1616]
MKYTYDIDKRFNGKKLYDYWLEDSCYKSDRLMKEGGRTFKRFYNTLAQHIFDINLEIRKKANEFYPIVRNERSNSAAIAMALSLQTPYVISEYGIGCKDENWHDDTDDTREQQRRFIDFWCATEDFKLEMWIESKHCWFNVGKGAKWEFDTGSKKRIQGALKQIRDIEGLIKNGKATYGVKVALMSINVFCKREQTVDDLSELDFIPRDVTKMLEYEAREYLKQDVGVLVGALDLRPSIKTDKQDTYHIYGAEYLPYVLLGAIVLP